MLISNDSGQQGWKRFKYLYVLLIYYYIYSDIVGTELQNHRYYGSIFRRGPMLFIMTKLMSEHDLSYAFMAPCFHQGRLPNGRNGKKGGLNGNESMNDRNDKLFFNILFLFFMIRCNMICPVSLIQPNIESQGNKLKLF